MLAVLRVRCWGFLIVLMYIENSKNSLHYKKIAFDLELFIFCYGFHGFNYFNIANTLKK